MTTKQRQSSQKSNNATGSTRRGIHEGDTIVKRNKAHKPVTRITPGTDLLSSFSSRRTPRAFTPAPKVIVDPVRLSFNKAGESLLAVTKQYDWSLEEKRQAHAYLTQLFYGQIDNDMVAALSSKVRRAVELRFACSCWFQHTLLKEVTLPGMSTDAYVRDYASAQQKFPKKA